MAHVALDPVWEYLVDSVSAAQCFEQFEFQGCPRWSFALAPLHEWLESEGRAPAASRGRSPTYPIGAA